MCIGDEILDADANEECRESERLVGGVPERDVSVAGPQCDHGQDPMTEQFPAFVIQRYSQCRQVRKHHLRHTHGQYRHDIPGPASQNRAHLQSTRNGSVH